LEHAQSNRFRRIFTSLLWQQKEHPAYSFIHELGFDIKLEPVDMHNLENKKYELKNYKLTEKKSGIKNLESQNFK